MASGVVSTAKRPADDLYYNLGSFGRKISTQSRDAQTWFDRGLTWTYAFNHEEAIRCFEQTIAYDPSCAMGYWGLAFAAGPNYNKTWGIFDKRDLAASMRRCYEACGKARELLDGASDVERALVTALQSRFPVDHVEYDLTESEKAYATAMRKVYQQFGEDDLDVVALFADALMNSAPRKMFEVKTGKPIPSSPVFETKEVLERGLAMPAAQKHPGAPHLYIHLMEMSATPDIAIPPTENLRNNLIPDAGHLYHMPTHLDILVGDYQRSIDCNMKATLADDKFFAQAGGVNFYSYYRLHDYHSLIYAAMLAGQSRTALNACERMEATITEELLRVEVPPLANWMEFFKAVRVHVLVRFGMWEQLKQLVIPKDQDLYCVTTVMMHYGKGIAWAATGNLSEADSERELFRAAAKLVPPSRLDFPNRIVDILVVADAMLAGEIAYRRGDFTTAFSRMRDAIAADDSLHYTEPWPWMVPTRHAYGALSLEQGLVEQARGAYAEDLGLEKTITRAHQHPRNVWALHGYHESLVRLGRDDEAAEVKKELEVVAKGADVEVENSCFCRLETPPGVREV